MLWPTLVAFDVVASGGMLLAAVDKAGGLPFDDVDLFLTNSCHMNALVSGCNVVLHMLKDRGVLVPFEIEEPNVGIVNLVFRHPYARSGFATGYGQLSRLEERTVGPAVRGLVVRSSPGNVEPLKAGAPCAWNARRAA